ncbi:unnamed protein product, partial [Oppiella nova]
MAYSVMKLALCLCVILILQNELGHKVDGQRNQCNASGLKRLDELVAKFVTIGNSGRKFPESKGQALQKYCDQETKTLSEIEKYKNNCFQNLSKQVFGIYIYSFKGVIRNFCSKKESKRLDEIIACTPCMNKYSNVIGKCYDTIINELLGAKNAPENKRIPHMCCCNDYLKYLKCCEDGLAGKCEPKHIETGIWFTKMVFGDAINLLCGDYTEESDKCSKLEHLEVRAQVKKCDANNLRKVDLSVARIITIGNSGRQFPENKGVDLKKQNLNYVKDIEKYKNKCFKGLTKQVASILIYSLKHANFCTFQNSIAQLCSKESKKLDELIASTKCINTATPEIN